MNWKEKLARKVIPWLMHYVKGWMLLPTSEWDSVQSRMSWLIKRSNELEYHARLDIELLEAARDENDRLQEQVGQQEAAYAALMEEMEELLHG